MNTNEIKTFNYEGNSITFNSGDGVMVNATEMAKAFGKRAVDWLQNQQTQEFIEALTEVRKSTSADLVQVTKGGPNQGTWMHEDVAMEFARWLSPKFAIWCNDRIKELLTTGVVTASNDDEAILHAMQVLQKRVDESKARLQQAESTISDQQVLIQAKDEQIEKQTEDIKHLAPMADYTREVLQSTTDYTLTQVSKDLGFRSVHTFTKWLTDNGIMYRQSGQWIPNSKYSGFGYFRTRTCKYVKSDDTIGTSITTVITEKGRAMLHIVADKKGGVR